MTYNVITDATHNFLFRYNFCSTEEPMSSNIRLEPICGGLYPFIKLLPVRDKQSESFLSIYYKTPLDFLNIHLGKTGEKNEPNIQGGIN